MIDRNEIIRLSKLSKLHFTEDEINEIKNDLNNIFLYMKNLDELDLEDITPLYNVLELKGRVYEDKISKEIDEKDFIENSPKNYDGYISLPVIIGGENE